jgi:hypothetical protein
MKPSEIPTCPTCGHALRFEQHQSHDEIARLLCVTPRTVLDWARAGEFGPRVFVVGRTYLVPLTGFQAFVSRRALFLDSGELKPISARSPGELRRKANLVQNQSARCA